MDQCLEQSPKLDFSGLNLPLEIEPNRVFIRPNLGLVRNKKGPNRRYIALHENPHDIHQRR